MVSKQDAQQPAEPVVRKPYVKPEVEQVRLVLDEVVLGFCKTESGAGPLGAGNTCTFPNACSNGGS